jgi:hypothetical protein
MMELQEPYPLTVISPEANVLRSNRAADTLFARFIAEPAALGLQRDALGRQRDALGLQRDALGRQRDALRPQLNMFSLIFDPRLMRPFISNWATVAQQMLARLQRESLQRGGDERLSALAQRVLAFPDVPKTWHGPDFSADLEPVFSIHLQRQDISLAFFTTLTTFSSPRLVTLEELRIESSFPLDEATRHFCEANAAAAPGA